jgi:hypothetical protein|tara:strand:+ start:625 stop:804 length:180 start_codon:yes stop_codon:yes gene_type:complete
MGELIDFGSEKEKRDEAELLSLQVQVEAALAELGPVTSGPMWLDPETGDMVLLVEIELS